MGDSEWLMRLPALITWLATVALAAALVRKYFGPWMAVLVSLLLLVWGIAFLVVVILITTGRSSLGSILRYFGTAAAAQTILVGLALRAVSPNRPIILALALPMVVLSGWRLYGDLDSWKYPDWRAAILYVLQNPLVHQHIYASGTGRKLKQFTYYRDRFNLRTQVGHRFSYNGKMLEISPPRPPYHALHIRVLVGNEVLGNNIERIPGLIIPSGSILRHRLKFVNTVEIGKIRVLDYSLLPLGKTLKHPYLGMQNQQ